MLDGFVALFWSLAAAAAFGSPAVVGKYSPTKYLAFAGALTAASGFILFCAGLSLLAYRHGYRAALADSEAPVPLLVDASTVAPSVLACLIVYLSGVWFYWFYAVKPRL